MQQPIPRPKAKDDVRDLWKTVDVIVRMLNALLKLQVRSNTGRDRFDWGTENASLEIKGGGVAAAPEVHFPWRPYPAVFVGPPPANAALCFMIEPGNVSDGLAPQLPARRNLVVALAPQSVCYVWLEATVDGSGAMLALDYGYGSTLPTATTPADNTAGAPPPKAYDLLFVITSTLTAVDYTTVQQQRRTPLNLVPVVTQYGVGVSQNQRRMVFLPPSGVTGLP